jgi:hypothetical protein
MARFVDIENNGALVDAMHNLFSKCHFEHSDDCAMPSCKECIEKFFSKTYESLLPTTRIPLSNTRKTAVWIPVDEDKQKCSNCEVIFKIYAYPFSDNICCPNCGAMIISKKTG